LRRNPTTSCPREAGMTAVFLRRGRLGFLHARGSKPGGYVRIESLGGLERLDLDLAMSPKSPVSA
jgi:hypothetical protein